MKKVLISVLVAGCLLSLISCGEDKKAKGKESKWFMAQTEKAPVANVSATSEFVETKFSGNYLYYPANIVDGNLNTTWCPDDKEGSGIGEVITIEFTEAVSFNEIQIVNGFASIEHPDYYKKNNRIKAIQLTQIAGEYFNSKEIILEDECPDWQSIMFDTDQTAQFLAIRINDVYKGNKYDDTCLADIRLLYNGSVIPFTQIKELKAVQEENSKAMLQSDFEDKFNALIKNYNGHEGILLRQKGKNSCIFITHDSGDNYWYDDGGYWYEGEVTFGYDSYRAKLGNCRLIVNQRINYNDVKVVKVIRIDGNKVTINGVSYNVVKPSEVKTMDYWHP